MGISLGLSTRNSSAEQLLKPYLPSRPKPPLALPLPHSPSLPEPPQTTRGVCVWAPVSGALAPVLRTKTAPLV